MECAMGRTFLASTKARIRREMSDRRKGLAESVRFKKSRSIAQRLKHLDSYTQAKDILFFMSLDEEVQTWEMIVQAFQKGKRVYLPVIDQASKEIQISHLPKLNIEFEKKSYGIKAPHKSCWNFVSPKQIDFVLVPGLAFDLSGGRIGFGAGYYDRLLQAVSLKTVRVGVAFFFQVVACLPQSLTDQKVHMILTEKMPLCVDNPFSEGLVYNF